ncbi:hypothetical protein SAMN05216241_11721 [Limimonas halophila]|uniref:Uncharacterized protein n=1 Tax=Limimonas halophila TaxID=1082479 RepID=A0A1G7UVH6_9PROT|nr:hypothetical protein [Limimonas halophila]SDG51506.1 hypothetical protein SAMN05216241_11721 [Limimonas halophila]
MVTVPAYGLPSTVTQAHRHEVPGRFAPAIPAIAETLSTDNHEDPTDDQRRGGGETFTTSLERSFASAGAQLHGAPRFGLDLSNSAFASLFHETPPPKVRPALAPRAAMAYRRPVQMPPDGAELARRVSLMV